MAGEPYCAGAAVASGLDPRMRNVHPVAGGGRLRSKPHPRAADVADVACDSRGTFCMTRRGSRPTAAHPPKNAPPQARTARLSLQPFLPGREAARPPGGHRAFGVGVAAAVAVAFGNEQHVLAECGEIAPAEGAAISGRFAVLGAAELPPTGRGQSVHHRLEGSQASIVRRSMERREERIVIETNRYRITGTLQLPLAGYRSRLTDYLNASEREFLALTDVEITPLDGDTMPQLHSFIAVAISQVVLARPEGEHSG